MHRRLGGQSGAFGGVHDGRAERRPSVGTGSYPVRQWAFYLRFCLPAMAAAAAIVPSGMPPVGRRHAWCEGSRIYCGVSRVSRRRSNARPTPAFGPRPGPDGRRGALEVALWPRNLAFGHHGRSVQLPRPGRRPGQPSAGHAWIAPATNDTAAGIGRRSRPGRPVVSRRPHVRRWASGRASQPNHVGRDQDPIA